MPNGLLDTPAPQPSSVTDSCGDQDDGNDDLALIMGLLQMRINSQR